ncbi:MAG: WecB/TagA/CpsF family glycosyltransferase [Bacteroidota bacterium]|nr:WecB/TagA/CpsF family glycosyltransferase [Bacteroidota bacterium]
MQKKLLNYQIYREPLSQIDLKNNKIINTINPHSYCVARVENKFDRALKSSDILLPDGVGIVWAEKFLNKNKILRITGFDIFKFLMEKLNAKKGTCFFLGSDQRTLNLIKEKALLEFPNVSVNFYSPPYKIEFSLEDSIKMCNAVNAVQPDVLFVGMTAPKQEKWVYSFKNKLETKNICCIGAVFDFYAGNIKRSSDFSIKYGLEWLPRLVREPKRLFYRNFVSTPKFILEVLSFKLFKKGIL